MRISFLIGNMGVRGSIRRIVELSNNLIKRGHDVKIYHSDGSPCSWLTCAARTAPELQAALDDHDCLIYFGDPDHWEMVKAANVRVRCLYFLGLDERLPNLNEIIRGEVVYDRRAKAISEAINYPGCVMLANCTALYQFIKRLGVKAKAYPVIGGVNFDLFYQREIERDPNMILAGGAKRDIEGTQVVLDAMEIIKENRPDAHLELYAKRGYSQEKLAQLYSSATVFIDAQRYGGWNNPVAEAMACGCSVVCSSIWGNMDFAKNQKTALVADHPLKIAQAAIQLMDNPELRERLTQAAYEKVRPYTWQNATDQLEFAINRELR